MGSPDWVRVRLSSGSEATLSAAYVAGIDDLEVLDAPATNRRGVPLSASRKNGRRQKPRTTVKKAAAKKTAASSTTNGGVAAETSKEGTA